jgi:hypothetical protein
MQSTPSILYEAHGDGMARDHMLVAGIYATLTEYYMKQETGFR